MRPRVTRSNASPSPQRLGVATSVTLRQPPSTSPRRGGHQQAIKDRSEHAASLRGRSRRDRRAVASQRREERAAAPTQQVSRLPGRCRHRLDGLPKEPPGRQPRHVDRRSVLPPTASYAPDAQTFRVPTQRPPTKRKLRWRCPGGRRFGRQNALPTPKDPTRMVGTRSQARCRLCATTTDVAVGVISEMPPRARQLTRPNGWSTMTLDVTTGARRTSLHGLAPSVRCAEPLQAEARRDPLCSG
jgi:hypothetical protein